MRSESERLGEILERVERREREGPRCAERLGIALLRNYTLEPIIPFLKHWCFAADLQPEIAIGNYDTVRQEVLDPESLVYQPGVDLVVVSWLLEHLDPRSRCADWDESAAQREVLATLEELVRRSSSLIVVNTLIPPLFTENGFGAGLSADHRVSRVESVNMAIRRFAAANAGRVFVIDHSRLVRMLGEERSMDRRMGYMFRAPFTRSFLELYAREIVRIGAAARGRTRKCLVLDCDNTLWGGIVGEDGLEGIALDPHEFPGRCYHEFQQSVLNLVSSGVIVALCSKNNEADVLDVLDHHPHCLLKRSHLAAWQIGWQDKPSAIRELATRLNIGLDSMVFVDDSEMECAHVREALPQVSVLRVPSRLFDLPQLVFASGLFDSLSLTREDRVRTAMYVAQRDRGELMQSCKSLEEYIAALEVKAVIHPALETEMPRVAQLVAKTNQFNLTTIRYNEAELRRLATGPDSAVYSLTASDRFGDLGLVGVFIARKNGSIGIIDSLLLSCRALGRSLENVFVSRCLNRLEPLWGVDRWMASYVRSPKNQQVENFWSRMGFVPGVSTDERTEYSAEARKSGWAESAHVRIDE